MKRKWVDECAPYQLYRKVEAEDRHDQCRQGQQWEQRNPVRVVSSDKNLGRGCKQDA